MSAARAREEGEWQAEEEGKASGALRRGVGKKIILLRKGRGVGALGLGTEAGAEGPPPAAAPGEDAAQAAPAGAEAVQAVPKKQWGGRQWKKRTEGSQATEAQAEPTGAEAEQAVPKKKKQWGGRRWKTGTEESQAMATEAPPADGGEGAAAGE